MSGATIVTLLTDFGSLDTYVAEVKAVILRRAPNVRLVDITHEVPPGDVRRAQYLLARAWKQFPSGTVHLAVVDPGVGTGRRAIGARAYDHFFVAPDNGLLSPLLDDAEVVALRVPEDASPTFHGRDVFAAAVAEVAVGQPLHTLGSTVTDPCELPMPRASRMNGQIVGEVVSVDRFGNLITNIPGEWCVGGTVSVGDVAVGPVRRTFRDVPPGALLAYVGSSGTLEVGVRDASATAALGAQSGAAVTFSA